MLVRVYHASDVKICFEARSNISIPEFSSVQSFAELMLNIVTVRQMLLNRELVWIANPPPNSILQYYLKLIKNKS